MKKIQLLYSGKAKTLFSTSKPDQLVMMFRNDTSAFDGEKKASLTGKGRVNNLFNAHIMQLLEKKGVPTNFLELLCDQESLVRSLKMLPVECVVRNYTAGSICRRYGLEAGLALEQPLVEFFLKDDKYRDPLITEQHMLTFGWASAAQIDLMKKYSLEINEILSDYFEQHGLILVDFKLEFGHADGKLYLGDEFTPDGCRIWDKKTRAVYDKDLFRQDLGDLVAGYSLAAEKLGISV